LCENDKSLVLIQNTFNELIRWPEPPQMAAIDAVYTNEVSQSSWQRLTRG
jgi:hypothetical protein